MQRYQTKIPKHGKSFGDAYMDQSRTVTKCPRQADKRTADTWGFTEYENMRKLLS